MGHSFDRGLLSKKDGKGRRKRNQFFALMGLKFEELAIKANHDELKYAANKELNSRMRFGPTKSSGLLKFKIIGLVFALVCIFASIESSQASPIFDFWAPNPYSRGHHKDMRDGYDYELERYLNEINRLRRHMAAVTTPPSPYKRGGSNCLFNGGLAHNCDYRDVIASVNDMGHWGSALSPGKRRKK